LNHTALTVEAARSRGLDVEGIVICGFPVEPTLAERTNPAELEKLCGTTIVGVVPTLEAVTSAALAEAAAWFSPALGGTFVRRTFVGSLRPRLRSTSASG
jgi:dethiobiotin synthetase